MLSEHISHSVAIPLEWQMGSLKCRISNQVFQASVGVSWTLTNEFLCQFWASTHNAVSAKKRPDLLL
ncbi:hypothetical protein AX14_008287 [Amanita brunnescens Koide BX004]|nr:hypothetical protein AX14_008287 [Amanita brunnescens Koide BX004]